jgi:hypothetical protein
MPKPESGKKPAIKKKPIGVQWAVGQSVIAVRQGDA